MNPTRRLSLMKADDEPLGPVDPDYALIGDYLDRSLTMRQAAEFERRLVDDAEFFEKAWPLITIWYLPRNVRARRERARARRAGLVRKPEPAPAIAPPAAIAEYLEPVNGIRRFLPTINKGVATMLKAATFAMMVLSAGYTYYARQYLPYLPPTTTYAARAPLTDIPKQSVQIETSVGETKEIPLRGGSRVLLRPSSRLTFGYIPLAGVKGLTAALDGEMAIELTKDDFMMDLRTSSGRAMFTPGTYAVRCEAGCTAMLLTVGIGTVRIKGDSTTGMTLTAGEKGMVPKRGAPEKVTPGDNWPLLWPARVP